MKKSGIILIAIIAAAVLVGATVTYAFFSNVGGKEVVELKSKDYDLTLDWTGDGVDSSGALTVPPSSPDNSFTPEEKAGILRAGIRYTSGKDFADVTVGVTAVKFTPAEGKTPTDEEIAYVGAVLEYGFAAFPKDSESWKTELPAAWAEQGVQTSLGTVSARARGTIMFCTRFTVSSELVPPECIGGKFVFTVSAECTV